MTHEQFIISETAFLAKQAGFDWESRFDNQQQRDEWQQVALVEVSDPDYNDAMGDPYSDEFIPFMSPTMFVMLPHVTQSVLQRWLREIKGIYLHIAFDKAENGWYTYIPDTDEYSETYSTFEEALEVGLQNCLKLLIENYGNICNIEN